MKPKTRAYIELHIAIFLFGFTAILGEVISLDAVVLVWWRVFLASLSLFFLIGFGKKLKEIPKNDIFKFMGIGVLVALHWVLFFASIKFSNPSICLICMATASFFTSFLEPLILKQKAKLYEIALGLLIIPGMILVVQSTKASMMYGIVFGLMSAFLAALFATLNKQLVNKADSMSITFLELGSGLLFLSLLMPIYFNFGENLNFIPAASDWKYLFILAFACTTFAYVLALRSLKHISAFASNLSINLEPIYGIALAAFLLNDRNELTNEFYYGALIILMAVFSYPFLKKKFEVKGIEVK